MKDFKKTTADFYRNIANQDGISSDGQMERRLALSLGYTEEDLELGANLGLGCGNPIENANLKETDILVDLGSGKGMDVFKASKIVTKGKAIGIDKLPEMVEKASYIKEKRGFDNTDFIVSDVDDINLPDNFCDCVISNYVINLLPDKKKVYQEIYRILKPGGRLSISDIVQINPLPQEILDDPHMHAT